MCGSGDPEHYYIMVKVTLVLYISSCIYISLFRDAVVGE